MYVFPVPVFQKSATPLSYLSCVDWIFIHVDKTPRQRYDVAHRKPSNRGFMGYCTVYMMLIAISNKVESKQLDLLKQVEIEQWDLHWQTNNAHGCPLLKRKPLSQRMNGELPAIGCSILQTALGICANMNYRIFQLKVLPPSVVIYSPIAIMVCSTERIANEGLFYIGLFHHFLWIPFLWQSVISSHISDKMCLKQCQCLLPVNMNSKSSMGIFCIFPHNWENHPKYRRILDQAWKFQVSVCELNDGVLLSRKHSRAHKFCGRPGHIFFFVYCRVLKHFGRSADTESLLTDCHKHILFVSGNWLNGFLVAFMTITSKAGTVCFLQNCQSYQLADSKNISQSRFCKQRIRPGERAFRHFERFKTKVWTSAGLLSQTFYENYVPTSQTFNNLHKKAVLSFRECNFQDCNISTNCVLLTTQIFS